MKNKAFKHILKAYTCSRFPRLVYEELSDMMLTFELIDSLALDILRGRRVVPPAAALLTKAEKERIAEAISNPAFEKQLRDELLIFYRLTVLVIAIIEKHYLPA